MNLFVNLLIRRREVFFYIFHLCIINHFLKQHRLFPDHFEESDDKEIFFHAFP